MLNLMRDTTRIRLQLPGNPGRVRELKFHDPWDEQDGLVLYLARSAIPESAHKCLSRSRMAGQLLWNDPPPQPPPQVSRGACDSQTRKTLAPPKSTFPDVFNYA